MMSTFYSKHSVVTVILSFYELELSRKTLISARGSKRDHDRDRHEQGMREQGNHAWQHQWPGQPQHGTCVLALPLQLGPLRQPLR